MGPQRRSFLRLAAGAIMLSAMPARAAEGVNFMPPPRPMRYTRRLDRELSGDASVVVSRSFGIRFASNPQGYRVEGRQIGVEVSAPPALEAIMRLEKEREELGLFPLLLDSQGRIAGLDRAGGVSSLDEAVREVSARLAGQPFDPLERAQLNQFVNALHQSAGHLVSVLPNDLFAPADEQRTEKREIALPGGASGLVTVTFTASRDGTTGLMRKARREVVTELLQERRRTIESWLLEPLA